MAQVKNVKYGIMNNNCDKTILKKMSVSERNIYHCSQSEVLWSKLEMGDSLCVATVKSFARSAYELVTKLQNLSSKGIAFSSSNEKYLNFSTINAMPDSTTTLLRNIAQREMEFVQYVQKLPVNQNIKYQLINRIQWESMTDIVSMFHSNGVIKKR